MKIQKKIWGGGWGGVGSGGGERRVGGQGGCEGVKGEVKFL